VERELGRTKGEHVVTVLAAIVTRGEPSRPGLHKDPGLARPPLEPIEPIDSGHRPVMSAGAPVTPRNEPGDHVWICGAGLAAL